MDDWVVAERDRPVAVRADLCIVGATWSLSGPNQLGLRSAVVKLSIVLTWNILRSGLQVSLLVYFTTDEDALLLASRHLAPPTSLDDTQNRYRALR